jgi:hypothetical protein
MDENEQKMFIHVSIKQLFQGICCKTYFPKDKLKYFFPQHKVN